MSSKKHVDTAADLSKSYEENAIGFKGIISFSVGLLLLIIITFGLMSAFLGVLWDYRKETADPANPMAMTEKERLPAEPRLQSAPGFGVDSEKGRVNLELAIPQAEYRELQKQWAHLLEFGRKDEKTGVITAMPIHTAIDKLIEQKVKAKSGSEAEALLTSARSYVSDSSAGRIASGTRR